MAQFLDTDGDSDDSRDSWMSWYVSLQGHEHLLEVDEDFVRDNFNLYGLRQMVDNYDNALEMILSSETPDDTDVKDQDFIDVYQAASELYALVHARFSLTVRGMQLMREKFVRAEYGRCPRALCEEQPCLPCGLSDELGEHYRIYCPLCQQTFKPRVKFPDLDGAAFGTSVPLMFFLTFPSLQPGVLPKFFVPRVFGFKVKGCESVVKGMLREKKQARKWVDRRLDDSDSDL